VDGGCGTMGDVILDRGRGWVAARHHVTLVNNKT